MDKWPERYKIIREYFNYSLLHLQKNIVVSETVEIGNVVPLSQYRASPEIDVCRSAWLFTYATSIISRI